MTTRTNVEHEPLQHGAHGRVWPAGDEGPAAGHLQCPFCHAYDVSRLFVATLAVDSCRCMTCGSTWEEHWGSGRYHRPSEQTSILVPEDRSA